MHSWAKSVAQARKLWGSSYPLMIGQSTSYHLTKQNANKRIFMVNGEDVRAVLAGKVKFVELLHAKNEELNLSAEPFKAFQDLFPQHSH